MIKFLELNEGAKISWLAFVNKLRVLREFTTE